MILYNVTFNLADKRNVLEPTIPKSAAEDENKTIKRVCLTDSVEHCIQAIAIDCREVKIGARLIVRSINTNYLNSKFLLDPQFLKDNNYVPDAIENHEYWYLEKIDSSAIQIRYYTIADFSAEYTIAWSCIKLEDCSKLIKKYLKDFDTQKFTDAKDMYEKAMSYCNKHKLWDAEDAIWDSIVELPWAQKTEIKSVQLIPINNGKSVDVQKVQAFE